MGKLDTLLKIIKGVVGGIELPKEISNNTAHASVEISAFKHEQTVTFNGPVVLINSSTPEGQEIGRQILEQQQQLLDKGDRAVELDVGLLIEQASASAINQAADEALLKQLTGVIPPRDIAIVSAALFVRRLYKHGANVARYKQLISQKYGLRGTNITNLVSADYYDGYLLPLHAQLVATEGELAQSIFNDIYEESVTQYPFAVFVGAAKEYARLKEEVVQKIQFNLLNKQHLLNIHGIGRANAKTIRTLLEDPDITRLYLAEPDIRELGKTVYARIYF